MTSASSARFVAPAFPCGGPGDPAPYFRREFSVEPGLRGARLRITALGIVEPYVNGVRVGDEMLAPGWTSYRNRVIVSTHDISDLVVPGVNVVGAIVGEGWAVGRLGWENKRHHFTDRPALYAQIEVEYTDRIDVIGTDDAFVASTGAVLSASIYDGEEYDARLEPDGWCRAGFDASGWSPVETVDWSLDTLVDAAAPPIRRIEEVAPVSITAKGNGRWIVDFGQNIAGWLSLEVDGERGQTVTMRHGEWLTGGEIDRETLRGVEATDRYTLKGGGPERWEPRFTYHGFRYAELDGYPGELTDAAIRAVVIHSDMTRTGWFETSNELLNRLHSNVVWSMRGNFVGIPTDCPQRDERLAYTGDLHVFAPTGAFLYDVRGVIGSWLDDLAIEHEQMGGVPFVVPDVLGFTMSSAIWGDATVNVPWALYWEYGDAEILRRSYRSMTSFVGSVESSLDEHDLWVGTRQLGDWLDPDAPPNNPAGAKTEANLVACAYLCKTTRTIARVAEILDHPDDAMHYADLDRRVRAAFRREYVSEAGRVVGETAAAYALAIAFELLDPQQTERAGNRLADLVAKNGYRMSTGFAATPVVLSALSSTGHSEQAYLLLLETNCPSFLYPVTMGATTMWERWDAVRPDGTINPTGMTSLNHFAFGAVADWLHRVVAGVQIVEAGYRRMQIAPDIGGGLTHATATHDTVHGRVEVAWRIDDDHFDLTTTIPVGTEATVVLPLHDAETSVVGIGPGTHHHRYPLPAGRDRRNFTLDTTLAELATDPAAWRAVTEVFGRHLPNAPMERTAASTTMTVAAALEVLPGQLADSIRRDLSEALGINDD